MSNDDTIEARSARRRRNVGRAVIVAVLIVVFVLIVRACQGDRPYVASAATAAEQDTRTVAALNAFMKVNGGVAQWKDYYDEGDSRPEPFTELTGYSVCSNRDMLGFTTGDVGGRNEVNLSSTSKVIPREVLDNAEQVWAKDGIERRSDDRGQSAWTQVKYDAGRTGPTFYVSYYGDNPDAKVSMLVLAASVCSDFPDQ